MAADAKLPPGMKPFQPGGHGKFHVTGWTSPEQLIEWDVTVPQDDTYAVNVLLRRHGNQPLNIAVTAAGQRLVGKVPETERGWTRCSFDDTVRLPAGKHRIVLQAQTLDKGAGFDASVFSIELVRPAVRERLHASALKLRSDTRWLQDCRFGLMCHWTSQSFPRRGERKPYAMAVQDFDVESFANQVESTGAGFVVFTTSHAEQFFPAPLESLDRILPGRTARRDLVRELADALARRGVKLILYYHLGANSDPAWLKATGFWDTDATRLFDNWVAIVSEVGRRYGDKLAGWWFDDGAISYYYRSAPWERLAMAAKAGYAGRLVGFNPWELPSVTEFQDYFCGEGNADPCAGGLLTVGGDGHLKSGSHQGLQACATLITEGDWVHSRKNTDIGPPRWNAQQMTSLLKEFSARKNVPIFNLEIYQDGTLSPVTVDMFKQAGEVRLFTYFRDNGQAGVFLGSSEDGVKFTPLNDDKPIFTPPAWPGQNLTRDASILHRDGLFRMVWTTQWKGRIFGYAESRDLIHWSEPKQVQPFPGSLSKTDQPENIWAPEIHWDPFKQDYFILFASTTERERTDGDGSDNKGNNTSPYDNRIYITRTRDGHQFSDAALFFDQGFSCIDAVMRLDETSERWIMVVKNSRDFDLKLRPGRNLWLTFTGRDLDHPDFTAAAGPIAGTHSPMFSNPDPRKSMAEGQSLVRFKNQWWLYWDEPAGDGIQVATSSDLKTWIHVKGAVFPAGAKHGTVFLAPKAAVDGLRHTPPAKVTP